VEVENMKKIIRSSWKKEDEDEGFYSEDFRTALVEDDEIDNWEAAFMRGYDEAG
jgi:hypothetical protein